MTSCGFIMLAEHLINPNNEQPSLPETGKDAKTYYSKAVADNFPKYIWVNIIVIIIDSVVAVILIFPYPENEIEEIEESHDKISDNKEDIPILDKRDSIYKDDEFNEKEEKKNEEVNEEEEEEEKEKISENETVLKGILSWRFFNTIIMVVLFDGKLIVT